MKILVANVHAQQTNDTFFLAKKKGLLGKIGKSISVNNAPVDEVLNATRISEPFIAYKGKTITRIVFNNVTFAGSVNDTLAQVKNLLTKIANQLQPKTKEKIVRNTMFFKPGETVFPNLIADNERYLREQPFFQDARIIVQPNAYDTNTVTVKVLYKDVISVGGNIQVTTNTAYVSVENNNFMGDGQRIGLETYYNNNRNPRMGIGGFYSKTNINGSFVNATIGIKSIAPTFNIGNREENMVFARLDLPLVSPFALWTGSVEVSLQQTANKFNTDSFYRTNINYKLANYDAWLGYNISGKIIEDEAIVRRVKHFMAIRFVNRSFSEIPTNFKNRFANIYADLKAVLASFTAFKQEYYRANYVYGFGRNEDIPKGFNVNITGGWVNRFNTPRTYVSTSTQFNFFNTNQQFYNAYAIASSHLNMRKLQDGNVLIGVETFSKLRKIGNGSKWMSRHFINASVAQQFNRHLDDPLSLNSTFGIPQFPFDSSVTTTQRIAASCESVFFNQQKIVGFKFAPFLYVSAAYLKSNRTAIRFYGDFFTAIGGGIKTRNESLVFGTMELRAFYFPKTIGTMQPFNIQFNTNLQFRYNSQYIKKPDIAIIN